MNVYVVIDTGPDEYRRLLNEDTYLHLRHRTSFSPYQPIKSVEIHP